MQKHPVIPRRQFLGNLAAAAASAPLLRAGISPAGEAAAKSPLAFTAAGKEYHFDTGSLRGTLRGEGKSLGLRPAVEVGSGKSLAGMFGLFSPYRLLTPQVRFGSAAWDWASRAELLADGAVQVQWTADKDHPLDITAVYRFAAPRALDFKATVKPREDLRRFELFLASYFDGFPACFAYVKEKPAADGKAGFFEATRAAGDWQMFPRDDEAVRTIGDGRWKLPPNPVDWRIMPKLAAPVALRRDAKSGLTAVLMAPAEDCFAISMPYGEEGHRSVYLSVLGRDLKAGEVSTARARLVVGPEISDSQAIGLYEGYVK